MAGAGKSLLSEHEVLEEDRVGNPDPVLGGGVGDLRQGGVGGREDGARDVQGEILDTAEIEEQVPLKTHIIRDNGELETGGGQMLR